MRISVKKITMVVLLLALTFSLAGCLKSNDTAVKGTITQFYDALKTENKTKIASLLDITFPGRDAFLAKLDYYFVSVQYNSITVNFSSVTVTGDVASVNGFTIDDVYVDSERIVGQSPFTFTLVKRSGKWYITDWE